MYKEDLLKARAGQCGLRIFFWGPDGSKITCAKCGTEHEVEVDAALSLSTGETREVVMLVVVWGAKNDDRVDVNLN
jgi:hypothetical protein